MKNLDQAVAIGLGGFVGALARWAAGLLFGTIFTGGFPVGTFFVNIAGSFFLGWFLTFSADHDVISPTVRLAVATGFVGAFTTFSTLMYESTRLSDEGAVVKAVMNLVGSVLVGLVAVKLGIVLGRRA